jgi:hypothetical protein
MTNPNCRILCAAAISLAVGARAEWVTNDGTQQKSIVAGHSGVAGGGEDRPPFMAVDGNFATDWDSAIDATDQSCWLAVDFGSSVTLVDFAITQRGDSTHDAKEHELQVGRRARRAL